MYIQTSNRHVKNAGPGTTSSEIGLGVYTWQVALYDWVQ